MKLLRKPATKLANQEVVGTEDVSLDIKHLVSLCNINKFTVLENFHVDSSSSPSGFFAELLPDESFECILYDNLFKGFMYKVVNVPKSKLKESYLESKKDQMKQILSDACLGKNAWCGLYRLIDLKTAEEKYAVACIADTGIDLDELLFNESGNKNSEVFKRLQPYEDIAYKNRVSILDKLTVLFDLVESNDPIDYVITGFKSNSYTYYSLASEHVVIQSPIDDIYILHPLPTLKAAQAQITNEPNLEEHNVIICEEKLYKYTQISHSKSIIVFKPLIIHISF